MSVSITLMFFHYNSIDGRNICGILGICLDLQKLGKSGVYYDLCQPYSSAES